MKHATKASALARSDPAAVSQIVEGHGNYNGTLLNGFIRHGHGVFTWGRSRNFDVYEGEFQNGTQTGFGVYYFSGVRSSYYKGEFVNGMFHGLGLHQSHPGDTYEGAWIDNMCHGNRQLAQY